MREDAAWFPGIVLMEWHKNKQRPALILANQARELYILSSLYSPKSDGALKLCPAPNAIAVLSDGKPTSSSLNTSLGMLTKPTPLQYPHQNTCRIASVEMDWSMGKKWISENTSVKNSAGLIQFSHYYLDGISI